MSQTGGGCRASNYIAFIRRALKKAGMEQIPVISVNLKRSGKQSRIQTYASISEESCLRCRIRRYPDEMRISYASL